MIKGILTKLLALFFTLAHGQREPQLDSLFNFYEQTENLNGVILIAEKGRVIYHKAFGYASLEWKVKNTLSTRFRTASISKLFTTVLCFQLYERGLLAPGQTINRYLPGFPNGDRITIHQLLTHTSGITDHRRVVGYHDRYGMYRATRNEWMQVFKDSALKFKPGTGWYYSNFGYNLLAMIIEKISGKSFEQNLRENIFNPAGMGNSFTMEHPGVIEELATGYERTPEGVKPAQYYDGSGMAGAGSVISTTSDLLLFMTALHGGKLLNSKNVDSLYSRLYKDEYGDYTAYNGRYFQQKLPGNDSTVITYFSGNHHGTHALIYDERRGDRQLILLLNIKSEKLFEMADNALNIVFGVPFDWPKDSYVRLFAKSIREKGVDQAVDEFRKRKKALGDQLRHYPRDLNRLGYYYLDKGNAAIAVEIFKLNLEYFPHADFYDSLGEAYYRLGNKEKAREYLNKAIEMDPANNHAKELLQQIDT